MGFNLDRRMYDLLRCSRRCGYVVAYPFDVRIAHLGAAGVPIRPDRDRALSDFAGWRVNYDGVLLALAGLTMAPYAPWSSDRSLQAHPGPSQGEGRKKEKKKKKKKKKKGKTAMKRFPVPT